MFKILAIGALGYAAYRYFGQQNADASDIRLGGGPLSDRARVLRSPE